MEEECVGQARFIYIEAGRAITSSFLWKQLSEEKGGLWWKVSLIRGSADCLGGQWMRSVGQARFIYTEAGRAIKSSFHWKKLSKEKGGL